MITFGGLTCKELVELVTDYLEGALCETERSRFEAHLADCADCPRYLDQMRLTITLTGRLAAEEISPAARAALLAGFRSWKLSPAPSLPGPTAGTPDGE